MHGSGMDLVRPWWCRMEREKQGLMCVCLRVIKLKLKYSRSTGGWLKSNTDPSVAEKRHNHPQRYFGPPSHSIYRLHTRAVANPAYAGRVPPVAAQLTSLSTYVRGPSIILLMPLALPSLDKT